KSPAASFVGSQACAECHAGESRSWRGSHHALAMQKADATSVLGRFDGASFEKDGARSLFSTKDGRYFVSTPGSDGKPTDFEIKYAFGFYPLQQYLIELPGERLQAFGLAWDARPAAQGGQRWFDLYPDRKLSPGDPLHWSGVDQNWNFQCAWCHTTNLQKNYDTASNGFSTRWSELGVGCEACHGPASTHLAWARQDGAQRAAAPLKGLTRSFDERRGASWPMNDNGQAFRSAPLKTQKEVLVCAGCHARRAQFSDDPASVGLFYEAFRPSLIETPLYHLDGQQRDEAFEFGSFLQSKMHLAGVTCSDCHDPHSGRLRKSGDDVCTQCHASEHFATPSHHHHAQGSPGSRCVECHMPATVYMGVDARRDHSLRIPRPDRTMSLQTPNACNQCHADRPPCWAAEAIRSWGVPPQGFQNFAESFAAAENGAPGATAALANVVEGAGQSALARASALARLASRPTREGIRLAARALAIDDPLARFAAIGVLAKADAATRAKTLPPLLDDKTRLVRMEAARALAGEAESALPPADRARFDQALQEYVGAQLFNAERAESHCNLGALYGARGQAEKSRDEYERALALDPAFFPAAVALAEIARASGDEAGAETLLRKALVKNPEAGALHHALGLSLIRQRRAAEALAELAEGAKRAPENPRFAYVYGVALHDLGEREKALTTLREALLRFPNDGDILYALASYELEAKDEALAIARLETLLRLEPENEKARALLRSSQQKAR
ncbi:MAG TPA: multiheme c-type cytochrome, partial [Methylocystis sp.]|nr:multiheme c-type cytochrome [Methylocystis sp.]